MPTFGLRTVDQSIGGKPSPLETHAMTPRELEEYKALRATIRERGTARIWILTLGVGLWAALATATAAVSGVPLFTLVPLVVLATVFEGVCALHFGVERIGRYLHVFHDDGWEHTALAFGRGVRGGASAPLFGVLFAAATILNFIPVLLAQPTPIEIEAIGAAHAVFLLRVALAHRAAARQRATEQRRFEELKKA
jgi:hypothetical protein